MTELTYPLSPDQYDLLYQIGQGPFTKVYLARCHSNGRLVAAKLMNLGSCEYDYPLMKKEMIFWQSAHDHPNVVKYLGSFIHDSTIWILQEYLNGGSIYDILQFGYNHGFKEESLIATILREVLNFLSYFHKREQVHRHLQSSSILLSNKGEIKVSDYGYSAGLFETGQRKNTKFIILGTACYTAPETISDSICREPADIWSLGIIALELALGHPPHSELTPMEQIISIIGENPSALPERYSSQFREFVSACLQKNPANRATALELLKHPFIRKSLECSHIEKVLMKSLPPLEKRFQAVRQNNLAMKQPFMGHENPVYFRFDVQDFDENSENDTEILVKTQVGKLFLTIKEPKVLPINEPLAQIQQQEESTHDEQPEKPKPAQMSLDEIINKVTDIEMSLATMEMDNFEMNKKVAQYTKIFEDLKNSGHS